MTIFVFCKARSQKMRLPLRQGRPTSLDLLVQLVPRYHTQTRPERGSGEMQATGNGDAAPDILLQRSGPKDWVEGLHASTGSKAAGPWSDHQQQAVLYRRC